MSSVELLEKIKSEHGIKAAKAKLSQMLYSAGVIRTRLDGGSSNSNFATREDFDCHYSSLIKWKTQNK
jgi:arginine repressor